MLVVQGRSLGRKEPLFPDVSVPLPPDVERGSSGITLRALLARVVQNEVAAFDARQAERSVLRALTGKELAAGVARGKVAAGESDVPRVIVEPDAAVATACQAFEDGLFLVFLDGVEQKALDAQVWPKAESRLLLVRLALLAGG
ncbi:MAG: hypothetical protein IPJ77_15105 [Planctomycetes bacterium]|nr:hypothetical protein [Planctomycetota bacterium]